MYFLALAADFDGTLATDGVVAPATLDALRRLKASGRRLILVTGRELPPLQAAFAGIDLFDRVVAENGALIYDPATGHERLLAEPASPAFLDALAGRNVGNVSVGRCIVAAWEPHQGAILETIHRLGLELQVIFNKGAVMVLPSGVNKASGLRAALQDLALSFHNVVAVGDAENDHAFLRECGCAAVVANALPSVKAEADIVLQGDHGAGVAELIDRMIDDEASLVTPQRQALRLGTDWAGADVPLFAAGGSLLIAGASGSGKSKLSSALIEQMVERRFEFCVVDPEGDYGGMVGAVGVGDVTTPPAAAEAIAILHDGSLNLIVNTQALSLARRSALLRDLLRQTSALRAQTGRPHWVLIDEAHQALSGPEASGACEPLEMLPAAILVTLFPDALCPAALASVAAIFALGPDTAGALRAFARLSGAVPPEAWPDLAPGEGLYWAPRSGVAPKAVRAAVPRHDHRRHAGKYALGDVGLCRSFYFRGPDKRYNLPARNLQQFLDIGDAVDDRTWLHHLACGDYGRWFRDVIKDDGLAGEAEALRGEGRADAARARRQLRQAVCRRYASPITG